MDRNERIKKVNKLIEEISKRGRNFFKGKCGIAKIKYENKKYYAFSEYHGEWICISTKNGISPYKFNHGGTLWSLIRDFKYFD